VEYEVKLAITEMTVIMWMFGFPWKERKKMNSWRSVGL